LIQRPEDPDLSPSRARIRATIASVVDPPEELRQLRLVHKALADVNLLRIVQRLASGHASVTDLIEHVGLSQPLVSWHVSRLRAAGLIETRRNGRETLCRLRPESFEAFAARQRVILGLTDAPTGAAS
jgi:ArsR family transcriptional regulator, arsenate/arsenite/antimonite-responsive transcriptional repressor